MTGAGSLPGSAPDVGGDEDREHRPATAAARPPITRRKAKQAADAARRERHRLAEARLAAERAQRRADNQAARERDAAARAERQRVADVARDRARRQEEARHQRVVADETTRQAHAPADAAARAEQAAERERQRQAQTARRAARIAHARRRAERKAERRRAREAARRAEREAVQARAQGIDPYAILGIAPDATAEDVARAYRRLARAYHPDLHRDGTPAERAAREAQMRRVNGAYGLLGDAERRAAYDCLRRRP